MQRFSKIWIWIGRFFQIFIFLFLWLIQSTQVWQMSEKVAISENFKHRLTADLKRIFYFVLRFYAYMGSFTTPPCTFLNFCFPTSLMIVILTPTPLCHFTNKNRRDKPKKLERDLTRCISQKQFWGPRTFHFADRDLSNFLRNN